MSLAPNHFRGTPDSAARLALNYVRRYWFVLAVSLAFLFLFVHRYPKRLEVERTSDEVFVPDTIKGEKQNYPSKPPSANPVPTLEDSKISQPPAWRDEASNESSKLDSAAPVEGEGSPVKPATVNGAANITNNSVSSEDILEHSQRNKTIVQPNKTSHENESSKGEIYLEKPMSNGSNISRLFRKAQECLLDSPFVPTEMPKLLTKEYTPPPFAEMETHYKEMLELTKPIRGIRVHSYAGYSGPWIENDFISRFCCNYSLEYFNGLIPLFANWADASHTGQFRDGGLWSHEIGRNITKALRRDVIYVTVVQHDDGLGIHPMHKFGADQSWNVLVLSGGGYGHIPIPLLFNYHGLSYNGTRSDAGLLFSFCGTLYTAGYPAGAGQSRFKAISTLEKYSKEVGFEYTYYHGPKWREVTANTTLPLAPSGWGRSSFRLYEYLHMGFVPVNLWSDLEWLPYKDSPADLRNIAFSFGPAEFEEFVKTNSTLYKPPDGLARIEAMRLKIKPFLRSHYSFEGLADQIAKFFEDREENKTDLKCQRHPPDTNRLRKWNGLPLFR